MKPGTSVQWILILVCIMVCSTLDYVRGEHPRQILYPDEESLVPGSNVTKDAWPVEETQGAADERSSPMPSSEKERGLEEQIRQLMTERSNDRREAQADKQRLRGQNANAERKIKALQEQTQAALREIVEIKQVEAARMEA